MYRIAICDDDSASICYLKELVRRWADTSAHRASVRSYPSAEAFLFDYAEEGKGPFYLHKGRGYGFGLVRIDNIVPVVRRLSGPQQRGRSLRYRNSAVPVNDASPHGDR